MNETIPGRTLAAVLRKARRVEDFELSPYLRAIADGHAAPTRLRVALDSSLRRFLPHSPRRLTLAEQEALDRDERRNRLNHAAWLIPIESRVRKVGVRRGWFRPDPNESDRRWSTRTPDSEDMVRALLREYGRVRFNHPSGCGHKLQTQNEARAISFFHRCDQCA
jgi:hypothetical protein